MNAPRLRAGVIGWPISHSKSPRLHAFWLDRHAIDGTYEALAVEPGQLASTLRRLAGEGWRGVNVTLPHKEEALAVADEATPRAQAIGAANTMVFGKDGRIQADNTDAFGFLENLRDRAGDAWDAGRPACVLGAGGAARAVLFALLEAGVPEIRLANRTMARAESLAKSFGSRVVVIDWPDAARALPGAGLVVNTTSLGMAGQASLDLDLSCADSDAVATDIVYTPLITPFLERAARRGLSVVDGLGMLLHQGRPGFAAWFGVEPKVDEALRVHMLSP